MIGFITQGGYGFFVWGAFGMTFAALAAEVWQLRKEERTIRERVGRLVQLRQAAAAAECPTSPSGGAPTMIDDRRASDTPSEAALGQ